MDTSQMDDWDVFGDAKVISTHHEYGLMVKQKLP